MSIEQDYNTLKSNAFTFSLAKIPETIFRVTACNLPAITIPVPSECVPGISQTWSGTYTEYDEITFRFIVDEDLKAYKELFQWITLRRFADANKEVSEQELYSDGSLITLTNNANTNVIFKFVGMHPVSLGDLSFDTTIDPVPVTCNVTFRYSHFYPVN